MARHRMCSSLPLQTVYAAFHLGHHSLQKYSFRGFPNTKGYGSLSQFMLKYFSINLWNYHEWLEKG